MVLSRWMKALLRIGTACTLLFIYFPLVVLALYAFNRSRVTRWPIDGLSLGDYITPTLVSSVQFIGNVIYAQLGVGGNLPFAAAYVTVPMVIMIGYLLVARRLGAFENL